MVYKAIFFGYRCPRCNYPLSKRKEYQCPNCGQPIEWTTDEMEKKFKK